jgi:hypothetical protein
MSYRNDIVKFEAPRASNRQKYDGAAPLKILAMAEEGMFPEEWCAVLGISMRTLYNWANERPEFEEAVEAAWHLLHAFWARLLRENLTNPSLRQNAILQVMAKRFPTTWGNAPRNTLDHFLARNSGEAEKVQAHASTSGAPERAMTREEVRERIRVLQERIAERERDRLADRWVPAEGGSQARTVSE